MNQENVKLVYQGSVKNLYCVDEGKSLLFEFTDDYSIFDWGKMPDSIPQKGQALQSMAVSFFKLWQNPKTWIDLAVKMNRDDLNPIEKELLDDLIKHGLSTHYLGTETVLGQNLLKVKKVNVTPPRLRRDENPAIYLYPEKSLPWIDEFIPLEVIFRLGAPKGSSILKRQWSTQQWEELGLDAAPIEGERFAHPVIEFSTKLEDCDRLLTSKQAMEISGMDESDLARLKAISSLMALQLEYFFAGPGIDLWDGKFEFAASKFPGKKIELTVVDALGPDELRLSFEGALLSKEYLRQIYGKGQWAQAVSEAKQLSKGNPHWQNMVERDWGISPTPLPHAAREAAKSMYSILSEIIQKQVDHPELNLADYARALLSGLKIKMDQALKESLS